MSASVFTIVEEVEAGRIDDLRAVVATVAADPAGNAVLPFGRFDTLHFASVVVDVEEGLPPTLVVENNVDGPVDRWLAALVAGARAGVDALFSCCRGYPPAAADRAVVAWLADHVVRPGAYHVGATGRTLARIRQEAELHDAIEDFLDAEQAAGRLCDGPPEAVRTAVQGFVKADGRFPWATSSPPRQTRRQRLAAVARLAALALGVLVTSPVLVPALLVWLVVLRVKEMTDTVQTWAPDPDDVRAQLEREDVVAQNHLSSVIPVKPGFVRVTTLKIVLYVLNTLARVIYTTGELGGIPSIHFAHWSLINDDRHLVFVSNFDGSWQAYLGDFVDKAAVGLTAVWSNAVYFPRTLFVAFRGATDGPRFLAWARASQCATDAWYSAYPTLTMPMIDNNTAIREGLFGSINAAQVAAWARRL
ncbi:MAG: hypothetical protein ABR511_07230 [Acidimicrobiales bacterium]